MFHLTDESQLIFVQKSGPNLGETMQPNNAEVFAYSVKALAEENNLNLNYSNNISNTQTLEYLVVADLKRVSWDFGFTNAKMNAEIEYLLPDGSRVLINGIYNSIGGGTKSQNLFLAFLNANSQILKEIAE